MALFGRNKKKELAKGGSVSGGKKKEVPSAPSSPASFMSRSLSHILKHARITEKATMHSAESVYTFDIAEEATKRDVIQAVRALYKVTPRMVRVVSIPTKVRRNMRTGKRGMKRGGKKAYVYLKKGETITLG